MVDLKQYDDAWLGLGDTSKLNVNNELMKSVHVETLGFDVLRFMKMPENLCLAAKVFLNIDLLPIQAAILEELWIRPFPMLIMARGGSKSFLLAVYAMLRLLFVPENKIVIVGAAFRQAKVIFEYMETIWNNADILRSVCTGGGPRRDVDRCTMTINGSWAIAIPLGDGCLSPYTLMTYDDGFGYITETSRKKVWGVSKFKDIKGFHNNGIKSTKAITTKKGFTFEGTYNHRMRVLYGYDVVWKRADKMEDGDHILIDRSYRWHSGNFKCTDNEAYVLGAMIGDGCWTQKGLLRFTTKDKQLSDALLLLDSKWIKTKDGVHWNLYGKDKKQEWLDFWGMPVCYTKDKYLPKTIMSASRERMTACLKGLFDTDGTVQIITQKGGTSIGVGFCNTSKKLVYQMQYILLHYGIMSTVKSRNRNKNWNTVYELLITGQNSVIFADEIGFGLSRKQDKLLSGVKDKIRSTMVDDIIPNVKEKMLELSKKYSVKGMSYCKINDRKRMTFDFVSKFIDRYSFTKEPFIDTLKAMMNKNIYYDTITSIEDSESDTYDIYVPEDNEYCANGFFSHNSKIRGLRAYTILSDEFNSISPSIYETVVAGFVAVSADPVSNVKEAARRAAMTKAEIWTADAELKYQEKGGNQAIISGTAGYGFQHFAEYWRRYKAIIDSRGNSNKLKEIFETDELPENFDWRDYSIIRIPYELIPKGFMDDRQIMRARATIHTAIYNMEYSSVFSDDSDGFFKRSLIESCVSTEKNVAKSTWPSWCPTEFDSIVRGNSLYEYIYGVDPASERDNFSIIIIELRSDHSRIVYSWSTTRKDFKQRLAAGLTKEHDFYGFCARKIRDLMVLFPCKAIAMDAQGGGIAVEEALHDPDKLAPGEKPIWPAIDEDKEKDTDIQAGLHILHLCQFAKADWTAEANHGLRKDFEDRILLFPRFDPVTIELSIEEDKRRKTAFENANPDKQFNIYDTLEDCVMEIEELKDELSTITMTRTGTGVNSRDRWDTPEIKLPNGKKGRLRKDRYSALVIANMIARTIRRTPPAQVYDAIGGAAGAMGPGAKGQMYVGPSWFTEGMNQDIAMGISRK